MAFGIGSLGDIVGYVKIDGVDKALSDLNKVGQAADSTAKRAELGNKLMTASIVAGAAAFATSVIAASKFEDEMAKVNTVLNVSDEQFRALSAGVLELSKNTHLPTEQLTAGLRALSIAGAPVTEMMSLLGTATTAAEGGMTDVKTAVEGASAVVRAYKMDWSEFGKILDMQFAATKAGAGDFGQLGIAMKSLLPMASSLKVPIDELYATIASMAKVQGLDSTTSGLKMLLAAMSGSQGKWKAAGIEIFDVTGKFRGFGEIIGDLTKKFDSMSSEQQASFEASIGINKRMLSTVASLTSNFDDMQKTLGYVRNSTGSLEDAERKLQDTLGEQVELIGKKLKGAFIEFGESSSGVLKDSLKWLNEHPAALKSVASSTITLTVEIGALAAAYKIAAAASALLKTSWGPAALVIAGVMAAIVGVVAAFKSYEEEQKRSITQISEQMDNLKKLEDRYNSLRDVKVRTREQDEELKKVTSDLSGAYRELGVDIKTADFHFGNFNENIRLQKLSDLMEEQRKLSNEIERFGNVAAITGWQTGVFGAATAAATAVSKIFSKGEEDKRERLELVNAEILELNGVMEIYDETVKKVKPDIDGLMDILVASNKSASDQIALLTKNYTDTGITLGNFNGRLIETTDVVGKQADKVKESYFNWTEYSQLIRTITKDMGPMGTAIDIITDAWGSAYAKTETTNMSLGTIVDKMDKFAVITGIAGLALDLFGIGEKKVVLTTDQVLDRMGAFGESFRLAEERISELNSTVSKYGITAIGDLKIELDAAVSSMTDLYNETDGTSYKIKWMQDYMTYLISSLGEWSRALRILNNDYLDQANILVSDITNAWTYYGKSLDPTIISKFNEALGDQYDQLKQNQNEAVIGSAAWLDYESALLKGYYTIKLLKGQVKDIEGFKQFIKAADEGSDMWKAYGLNAKNVDMILENTWPTIIKTGETVNDINEKIIESTVAVDTWQDVLRNGAIGMGILNAAMDGMNKYGIETTEMLYQQKNDLELLLTTVKAGSYEYQQITDKLGDVYDKLGILNPYIEQQTADIIGLMDAWISFTDTISNKFSVFEEDAKTLKEQLDNIAYFKIDIETGDMEKNIGGAIYALQEYIDTLNPNSQAWIDANKTLTDIKNQFIDLGGSLTDIEPRFDVSAVVSGAEKTTNSILGIKTTAEQNPAVLIADTQNAIYTLGVLSGSYDYFKADIETRPINMYVNTASAWFLLDELVNELNYIVNRDWTAGVAINYQHNGGVLHEGGLLMHAGGPLFGEGAELLRAHSGLNLGTGGREEVPFIGLKGEYVLRNAFVDKYGVNNIETANNTLDAGALTGGREQVQQSEERPIKFEIHNANPQTWISLTDKYIHPRIKKNDLYTVKSTRF